MNTGVSEAACTRHALAHPRGIEARDDLINALRQALALVLDAVALGELVRQPVMAKGRVVLPDVVKILAEGVAQSDFVPERHGLGEHRFRALQPLAIVHGHFAVRGDARKGEGKVRVDFDRSFKKLVRRRELPTVGREFAKKGQRLDVVRLDGERGLAAGLRIGRAALLTQRKRKAQMRRRIVRLQRQGAPAKLATASSICRNSNSTLPRLQWLSA